MEAGFEQEANEPTQKKTKRFGSDVARSGYSRRTKSKGMEDLLYGCGIDSHV